MTSHHLTAWFFSHHAALAFMRSYADGHSRMNASASSSVEFQPIETRIDDMASSSLAPMAGEHMARL